jgi:hypothetical protein
MAVVPFTGITKNSVPVADVLDGAKDSDEVVILSWKGDDFVMAMSEPHAAGTLMMLELAKRQLMDSILYDQWYLAQATTGC